jgi:hypothetical protein
MAATAAPFPIEETTIAALHADLLASELDCCARSSPGCTVW